MKDQKVRGSFDTDPVDVSAELDPKLFAAE